MSEAPHARPKPYHDIWHLLQRADKYAYHYTRASTLVKILRSGELRLSVFARLNDPREAKDWSIGFHSAGADLELASREGLQESLNKHLKHSWRVGCFVADVPHAVVTQESTGAQTLSAMYERGYARPRMWAQYAQEYRGACLVFDRAKLDAAISSAAQVQGQAALHASVTYDNPNPSLDPFRPHHFMMLLDRLLQVGVEQACAEHVQMFWRELFMLKAKDWEHERELRWMVSATDDRPFVVGIKDCCVGIALGDRAPMSARRAVSMFAKRQGIELAVMGWKNGFPQPERDHWRLLLQRPIATK